MNKKKLLKKLRFALFWYTVSYYLPFLINLLDTKTGFCRYFNISNENSYIISYLRLIKEKNNIEHDKFSGYWFDVYDYGKNKHKSILPRIKLLKQAIKSLKQDLLIIPKLEKALKDYENVLLLYEINSSYASHFLIYNFCSYFYYNKHKNIIITELGIDCDTCNENYWYERNRFGHLQRIDNIKRTLKRLNKL